jgi:hypothetical protein
MSGDTIIFSISDPLDEGIYGFHYIKSQLDKIYNNIHANKLGQRHAEGKGSPLPANHLWLLAM